MEKKKTDKQEMPLGIYTILLLNILSLITVAVLAVLILIFANLPEGNVMRIGFYEGLDRESAEAVAQKLGGILTSAILPSITIRMVLKKKYVPTLVCIILQLLGCAAMCMNAFLAGIMLIVLLSSGAANEYLRGKHKYRAKEVTQNKRQK